VDVTYDWRLRAEKPLLRHLSLVLRALFEANHRWAMARGEESLRLELARRNAAEHERHLVPPPPGPADPRRFLVPATLLVLLFVVASYAVRRHRRDGDRGSDPRSRNDQRYSPEEVLLTRRWFGSGRALANEPNGTRTPAITTGSVLHKAA
jgi:hypothetical protein